ncbi:MAG: hemerythrin family protein [Pseudodesulfovibrio sp.]|nr:hemerythrin family protein [Pseudodesulfovibrio sp.]
MAKIKWNEELNVGVEQVDNQHKELIRIINGLINAVDLGRDKKTLENVLQKLREYTVFHFNSEEALMEEVRYNKRGEHINEHARLKRSIKDFQRNLYKHETLTSDMVLEFMKEWLLHHILSFDRELARFIHEQKAKENKPKPKQETASE